MDAGSPVVSRGDGAMKAQPIFGIALILLGVAGLSFLGGGFGSFPMGSGGPGGMGGPWMVPARRTGFASNGEQIYYTGVSRRTGPIPFRGGPMWLWMHGGSCVACHGVHGRGGVPTMMGTKTPSDIRYARLTEEHNREHREAAHPPYTDVLIKRALIEGVDPSGRQLDWTMPRWQLSDEDFHDLLVYLKTLK